MWQRKRTDPVVDDLARAPWHSGQVKGDGGPKTPAVSPTSMAGIMASILSFLGRLDGGRAGLGGESARSARHRRRSGATWSTATWRSALCGMSGKAASRGSWTTASPPQRLIAISPEVPSSSVPLSTTPMARRRAVDGGRAEQGIDRRPRAVLVRPAADVDVVAADEEVAVARRRVDGAVLDACPSSAATTPQARGRGQDLGSRSGARSPRWMTTNTAAGRSAGRSATSRRSASTPPAEAPTQTMSRLRRPWGLPCRLLTPSFPRHLQDTRPDGFRQG